VSNTYTTLEIDSKAFDAILSALALAGEEYVRRYVQRVEVFGKKDGEGKGLIYFGGEVALVREE
jgi:hypothetical protein